MSGCVITGVGAVSAFGVGLRPLLDGLAEGMRAVGPILMAAAGALELAACMLPFTRDLLPGTANHLERDPACAIDVIGETPRAARIDALMSNSFGFGGQNAAVVLGRA